MHTPPVVIHLTGEFGTIEWRFCDTLNRFLNTEDASSQKVIDEAIMPELTNTLVDVLNALTVSVIKGPDIAVKIRNATIAALMDDAFIND